MIDPYCILVVEDSESDFVIISRLLAKVWPKCKVTRVENPVEMNKFIGTESVDCILLDLHTPGHDAHDTIKSLDSLPMLMPVIAVTGIGVPPNTDIPVVVKGGDMATMLPEMIRVQMLAKAPINRELVRQIYSALKRTNEVCGHDDDNPGG